LRHAGDHFHQFGKAGDPLAREGACTMERLNSAELAAHRKRLRPSDCAITGACRRRRVL